MAHKMNPEVKALWLKDLRSGEHKQAHGFLNCKTGFCCLGRLTDLYIQNSANVEKKNWYPAGCSSHDVMEFDTSTASLPDTVAEWAGLENFHGFGPVLEPVKGRISLDTMNDGGFSFKEIADIIEAQL
jgi:hypothetical protein